MTQKILAAHAGLDSVSAGQLIEADLDLVLGNDITSPVAIHEINKMKVEGVFNKDKIALVMDHFAPNKDIKSAEHSPRSSSTTNGRKYSHFSGFTFRFSSRNLGNLSFSSFRMLAENPHIFMDTVLPSGSIVHVFPSSSV